MKNMAAIRRPVAKPPYFDVPFTVEQLHDAVRHIPSPSRKANQFALARYLYLAYPPAFYLEIGTWLGRSAAAVAYACAYKYHYFAVDDFSVKQFWNSGVQGKVKRVEHACRTYLKPFGVNVIKADSGTPEGCLKIYAAINPRNYPYGLVYIDGDH